MKQEKMSEGNKIMKVGGKRRGRIHEEGGSTCQQEKEEKKKDKRNRYNSEKKEPQ